MKFSITPKELFVKSGEQRHVDTTSFRGRIAKGAKALGFVFLDGTPRPPDHLLQC